jgi:hypothetical protein
LGTPSSHAGKAFAIFNDMVVGTVSTVEFPDDTFDITSLSTFTIPASLALAIAAFTGNTNATDLGYITPDPNTTIS